MKVKQQKLNDVPHLNNIKDIVKYGVQRGPKKKFLIFHNDKGEECTKTYEDAWNDINNFGTFLF
ncbi:MAG: hypothetical protein WCN92_07040, partial [Eubacteriales bacterium]